METDIDLKLSVNVVKDEALDEDFLNAGESPNDIYLRLSPRYSPKLCRKICRAVERTVRNNSKMLRAKPVQHPLVTYKVLGPDFITATFEVIERRDIDLFFKNKREAPAVLVASRDSVLLQEQQQHITFVLPTHVKLHDCLPGKYRVGITIT